MSQSQTTISGRVSKSKPPKKPALKNTASSKNNASKPRNRNTGLGPRPTPRPTPSGQSKNAPAPRTPSHNQASSRKKRRPVIASEEEDDDTEEDEAEVFDKSRRVSNSSNTTIGDVDEELDALEAEETENDGEGRPLVSSRSKKRQTRVHRDVVYQRQSNLSQDVKGCFITLETTCRIMFLCDFNLLAHEIIKEVWTDDVRTSDWEWEESAHRIGWNAANWKKRAIVNMEKRIREYKRADKENSLHAMSEYKDLAMFFGSKYSASSFTAVFDFVDGCIDIEETAEKSPQCQIFFKTIFANFGAKVKLYVDWAGNPSREVESPASRRNLLLWFNKMAFSNRFNVSPHMFVRLEGRKRERNSTLDTPPGPDDDQDYVFFDEGGDGDREGAGGTRAGTGLGGELDDAVGSDGADA